MNDETVSRWTFRVFHSFSLLILEHRCYETFFCTNRFWLLVSEHTCKQYDFPAKCNQLFSFIIPVSQSEHLLKVWEKILEKGCMMIISKISDSFRVFISTNKFNLSNLNWFIHSLILMMLNWWYRPVVNLI